MSAFFVNSSEILTLSLLNNKNFYFLQSEMAKAIGCSQPNISYVISALVNKGLVENTKGFIEVNQYRLVDCLVGYAEAVYQADIYFSKSILKIKNWTPEVYAFFKLYLRMFNIEYSATECKDPKEICFVFKDDVIDISDIP